MSNNTSTRANMIVSLALPRTFPSLVQLGFGPRQFRLQLTLGGLALDLVARRKPFGRNALRHAEHLLCDRSVYSAYPRKSDGNRGEVGWNSRFTQVGQRVSG